MPRVKVKLTAAMIAEAKPRDCYECLVALGLRQATGFEWHVTEDSARIETLAGPLGKKRRVWHFPPNVRELIKSFDNGLVIRPTAFYLPARFADKSWLNYGAGISN